MAPRPVRAPRRGELPVLASAVALAILVARTKTFTVPADVVVTLGYVLVLAVAWWRRDAGSRANISSPNAPLRWRRARGWIGLALLTVTWEFVALAGHPRRDHPTLSSLTNAFDHAPVSRGLFFAAWLVLGLALASP